MNVLLTVFRKEIVDGLRDRRSLLSALMLPLMFPLLITFMFNTTSVQLAYFLVSFILVLFLPTVVNILQAKLSQNREFAADLVATKILGSPTHLISALARLENYRRAFSFAWPSRRPTYFDSHPRTLERISRLKSYQDDADWINANRLRHHNPGAFVARTHPNQSRRLFRV